MVLHKMYLDKNRCYTGGRIIHPKGIMLHSVGVPQPKASVFVESWNNKDISVCVHAFIDANTGEVYQTLPWDRRGWHCGKGSKGSANDTHISVEMCEPAGIKYTGGSSFIVKEGKGPECAKAATTTYRSAVELFATLCYRYSLDPRKDGVIISHAEGYKRGIASNHGDPTHLWKGLGLNLSMDQFRKDVKETMGLQNESKPAEEAYRVKVTIDDLFIRKGPATTYPSRGFTGKGVFTIVDTYHDWGLLKSYEKDRDGWISLAYTTKV